MRQPCPPPFSPVANMAMAIKTQLLFSSVCLAVGVAITWPVLFCAIPAYAYSIQVRMIQLN